MLYMMTRTYLIKTLSHRIFYTVIINRCAGCQDSLNLGSNPHTHCSKAIIPVSNPVAQPNPAASPPTLMGR